MSDPSTDESGPLLFISHRHHDKAIADVLREFVMNRSAGQVRVFQSSAATHGLHLGDNLSDDLLDHLDEAEVLILIYTSQDNDWSYCMWECGVATDPNKTDTRVVVFQCADEVPAPFLDNVRVNVHSREDVTKFVNQLLTSNEFFPGHGEAISQFQPDGSQVTQASEALYAQLQEAIPQEVAESAEEWPAWPSLVAELSLNDVRALEEAQGNGAIDDVLQIVREQCVITEDQRVATDIFNRRRFEQDLKLGELARRWEQQYPDTTSNWTRVLYRQIAQAASWEYPDPEWEVMQDLQGQNLYAPMITHVRKVPTKSCIQIMVSFFPFELADGATQSVEVSVPDEYL